MRKPWVFLRFRLFGWNVFFIGSSVLCPPSGGAARKYIGRPFPRTDTLPGPGPAALAESRGKKVAKNPLAHGCR